jgi:hypothetical protein
MFFAKTADVGTPDGMGGIRYSIVIQKPLPS